MLNRRALLASAAAACLVGCLPSTPPPPPPPPKLPFWPGQTTAFSVQTTFVDPDPNVATALTNMDFHNFRGGYELAAIHYKGNDVWDWDRPDKWYAALPPGVRPLIITSSFGDVADPSNELLASYLGQFAARYPNCDYEIDNEPDLRQNWPVLFVGYDESWTLDQALAAYVAKATLVSAAIRAADPKATIVSGGTSGVDLDWINGLVNRGLFAGVVDACGVHPYGTDAGSVAIYYAPVVAALPQGVKIWSTEYGNPDTTTVKAMYDAHVAMGVPYFVWYRLEDTPNAKDGSTNWGLVTDAYAPKQPAYGYAQAINEALS